MNRANWIGCVLAVAGVSMGVMAQDKKPDAPVGTATISNVKSPQPMKMPYSQPASWSDKDLENVGKMLAGTWRTVNPVGQADDKAKSADVLLAIAPVHVDLLPNALYVEAARVDAPWAPFRQALWQVYKKKGQVHLRTIEFRTPKGAQSFLTSLWAAPDMFPAAIDLSETYATQDIAVTMDPSGKGLTGKTPYPYPTSKMGAVDMTSEFTVSGDSLTTSDQGLDADGKVVWGSAVGKGYQFQRFTPDVQVQRFDTGVIRINYGGTAQGDEIVTDSRVGLHTVGSLVSGTIFENSRARNQLVPFRVGQDMSVPGFNQGTKNLHKGERFKLLIPSDQAFGPQGNPRFKVPADAWLSYDIEVVTVEAPQPKAEADPKATMSPGATLAPTSHDGHDH